jgi:hypothetical protein
MLQKTSFKVFIVFATVISIFFTQIYIWDDQLYDYRQFYKILVVSAITGALVSLVLILLASSASSVPALS